ncbi:MAG TPA: HAMP domain-containing sensor histidine kinase [Candidatus Saccharimonadales bacterium]|nr:HAMP domain-containing sensor histidine kinase [Candidatus Saccharimonadales bacterium]
MRRSVGLAAMVVLAVFGVLVLARPALASDYGGGPYGGCGYNTCARAPVSTQTSLPSGLDVSINLVEGQIIPASGYTITVTPLNGAGTSFQKVEFYVDDTLVHTSTPDETGTVAWQWVPGDISNATMVIVVTGSGSSVTKTFHLAISKAAAAAPAGGTHTVTDVQQLSAYSGPLGALKQLLDSAANTVRTLPKPVVYSFPYALFALLGVDVLLLLLQAKRELKEYHSLQRRAAQEQTMAEVKKTLIDLVSHYLRSPLTVVSGGIDLLSPTPLKTQLTEQVNKLRADVERIVAQTKGFDQAPAATLQSGDALAAWRQPALLLPVLLIAAATLLCNYLTAHAGTFTLVEVNAAVQSVVFAAAALGVYQAFRRLQLRRRDAHTARIMAKEQATIGRTCDRLIADAGVLLGQDLGALDASIASAPDGLVNKFILEGQHGFQTVLNKFAIARQLQGAASTAPMQHVSLRTLVDEAAKGVADAAATQRVTIRQGTDMPIAVRNPELLAFTLRELLSNAIAYSSPKSEIVVAARQRGAQGMSITIADHGAGIPAAKLALVAQPFYKAEGAEVFTHAGMGFGLYLNKLIMRYLGGDSVITSHPGRGTLVTLRLPPEAVTSSDLAPLPLTANALSAA